MPQCVNGNTLLTWQVLVAINVRELLATRLLDNWSLVIATHTCYRLTHNSIHSDAEHTDRFFNKYFHMHLQWGHQKGVLTSQTPVTRVFFQSLFVLKRTSKLGIFLLMWLQLVLKKGLVEKKRYRDMTSSFTVIPARLSDVSLLSVNVHNLC